MNYLIAIKTAIIIFPFIALLITIPFILLSYHKYGSINKIKTLVIYSFILYLITIYFLVILPLPSFDTASKIPPPHFNFIPFNFVRDFIRETSLIITDASTYIKAIKEPCFYVAVFNIFMTIPFGMYLHYYFKFNFKKTLLYSMLLSLFFEITQGTGLYFIYPNPYRLCDIDDIILNTTGGLIGFGIMKLLEGFLPSREELDKRAYETGKKVSGLRRITIFCLDIFIFLSINSIIYIFTKSRLIHFITIIIYYIIIPILTKNQTLAMKFLNARMSYPNKDIFRNIIRNLFIHFYYLVLPFLLIYLSFLIFNTKIYSVFISLIFIVIFYLINILMILLKKKIYYDKLIKYEFKSTIKENEN